MYDGEQTTVDLLPGALVKEGFIYLFIYSYYILCIDLKLMFKVHELSLWCSIKVKRDIWVTQAWKANYEGTTFCIEDKTIDLGL